MGTTARTVVPNAVAKKEGRTVCSLKTNKGR